MLGADGNMWLDGRSRPVSGTPEGDFESIVEFNDFVDKSSDRKGYLTFQMRMELDEGTNMQLYMRLDSGQWEKISDMTASRKKTFLIPIVPRRCDHIRLKIVATGMWRLWALTRNRYTGSELFY